MDISPLFTIIIPTRNRPEDLNLALKKICEQTYQQFEVIVIDDGSYAEFRSKYDQIIARKGERFRLLSTCNNTIAGLGPSVARNLGMDEARGNYLCFCDDDDQWIDAGRLDRIATAIREGHEPDMIISEQVTFANDEMTRERWYSGLQAKGQTVIDAETCYHHGLISLTHNDILDSGNFIHLNTLIISKAIVRKVGGFWSHLRYVEDVDFTLRALDLSQELYFDPVQSTRHNAPEQRAKTNLSTQLHEFDKRMLQILMYQHVAALTKRKDVTRHALQHLGYTYKNFTMELVKAGCWPLALKMAGLGLSIRFTLGWACYVILLNLRYLKHRITTN